MWNEAKEMEEEEIETFNLLFPRFVLPRLLWNLWASLLSSLSSTISPHSNISSPSSRCHKWRRQCATSFRR